MMLTKRGQDIKEESTCLIFKHKSALLGAQPPCLWLTEVTFGCFGCLYIENLWGFVCPRVTSATFHAGRREFPNHISELGVLFLFNLILILKVDFIKSVLPPACFIKSTSGPHSRTMECTL